MEGIKITAVFDGIEKSTSKKSKVLKYALYNNENLFTKGIIYELEIQCLKNGAFSIRDIKRPEVKYKYNNVCDFMHEWNEVNKTFSF